MVNVAFKEWAAVCQQLAHGHQALILRKGGIHETAGQFRPDYDRFWLYPTLYHESQAVGLKPEVPHPANEPIAGTVALESLATVTEVHFLDRLETALSLDEFHGWTRETVTERFHYRRPGLYLLLVRVHTLPEPYNVPESAGYVGCKTWVPLDDTVPDSVEARLTPAMSDEAFAGVAARIQARLAD